MKETKYGRSGFALVFCFCLLLLPLCFTGYGSDFDTYGVLDAGRMTWGHGIPATSRHPGYWVFEAIVFVLARFGGYVLVNLATWAIACLTLWRFFRFAQRLGVRYAGLLTGCLLGIPVFVIAATSTDDYLWSLLGLILFAEMVVAERYVPAMLGATLCFGIRGSNGAVIAGMVICAVVADIVRGKKVSAGTLKAACAAAGAALIGSLPLIESYRYYGPSFLQMQGDISPAGVWSMKMRLGRFFFKVLYVIGPVAWAVLLVAVCTKSKNARSSNEISRPRERVTPLLLGAVGANIILFIKFPLEPSYLLPALLCGLLFLGYASFNSRSGLLLAFLCAVWSLNFISFQTFSPNEKNHASKAVWAPALVWGQTVQDTKEKLAVKDCTDAACWSARQ